MPQSTIRINWTDINKPESNAKSIHHYFQGLLNNTEVATHTQTWDDLAALYQQTIDSNDVSPKMRDLMIKSLKDFAVKLAKTLSITATAVEQQRYEDNAYVCRDLVTKIKDSPLINHHRGAIPLGDTGSFHKIAYIEQKAQSKNYKKWVSFLVNNANADINDLPLNITVASLKELMIKIIDKESLVQRAKTSEGKFTSKFDALENIFTAATIAQEATTISSTMLNKIVQAAKELSLDYVDLAAIEQLKVIKHQKETKNQTSQVAWVDNFITRVNNSHMVSYHRNLLSKGLDKLFSYIKTPSDALRPAIGIATTSDKKVSVKKQHAIVESNRAKTLNTSNDLQINWQALSYDDRPALNEQLYRGYLTWADQKNKYNETASLCEYLKLAFENCRDSYQDKLISKNEQHRVINALKRLQIDVAYHQMVSPHERQFSLPNPELVDYHLSSTSRKLGLETKTRASMNKLAQVYTGTDDKAIKDQQRIDRIFSKDTPGTIAHITEKMKIERLASEKNIDWDVLSHHDRSELKGQVLNNVKTAILSSTLPDNPTNFISSAKTIFAQLASIYHIAQQQYELGMIDKRTATATIPISKSLICDLVFCLLTKRETLAVGSVQRMEIDGLLSVIEESDLVKHHQRPSIKLFFTKNKTDTGATATQKEIATLINSFNDIEASTNHADIVARYTSKAADIDALLAPTSPLTEQRRASISNQ